MKLPRNFFKPLAIGAPAPLRELPLKLERMIHFVPPHIEKLRAKVPELVPSGRCRARQSRGRDPRRCQGSRPRRLHRHGESVRFRRHRPVDPRSTRSIRRGCSTTFARSSPRSATNSTSSCCRRSKAHGTSIISISCSPSLRPSTASRSRSSSTPSWRPPRASIMSPRSPPPRRACTASASVRPTLPRRAR